MKTRYHSFSNPITKNTLGSSLLDKMTTNAANNDEVAMLSYSADVTTLPTDFQHLLEVYSKIQADQTVAHVNAVVS